MRRVDGVTVYLTESAAAVLEAERHREADVKLWTAARRHWIGLALSVRAPVDLCRKIAAMPIRQIEADELYDDAGSPLPPPADIVAVYREAKAAVLHSLAAHSTVAELAAGTCCRACRADEGGLFKIAGELRKPRLPHDGCPRGLCGCDWFVAVPETKPARRRRKPRVVAPVTATPGVPSEAGRDAVDASETVDAVDAVDTVEGGEAGASDGIGAVDAVAAVAETGAVPPPSRSRRRTTDARPRP